MSADQFAQPSTSRLLAAGVGLARAGMVGAGIFAIVVGLRDALLATSLAARLAGTGIAVGGVLLGVAASQARRATDPAETGWRSLVGIAAGIVEASIGAFLLVAAFEEPSAADDPRWWGWAALAAVGVGTMAVYYAMGRGELAASLVRPIGLVASGAAVSLVVGLVQLWQGSTSAQTQENPTITMTVAVKRLGHKDGLDRFAAFFVARNVSDVPLLVLGSRYSATGIDTIQSLDETDQGFSARLRRDARVSYDLSRAEGVNDAELVQAGGFVPDAFTFFPDETYRTSTVLSVRPGRYDNLLVSSDIVVARQDRLRVDLLRADNPVREFPRAGVLDFPLPMVLSETLPVSEPSWIRRLTRPEIDLKRVYIADAATGAERVVVFGVRRGVGTAGGLSEENVEIARFYGLSATEARRQVHIGPGRVPSATAGDADDGERAAASRALAQAFGEPAAPDLEVLRIEHGNRRWLVQQGTSPPARLYAIYEVRDGTAGLLGFWPPTRPCPPGIPAAALEAADIRDPRSGACLRPRLSPKRPEGARSISRLLLAAVRTPFRRRLSTPFDAVGLIHPYDFVARRRGQDALAEAGFSGGACASRIVVGTNVRVCMVRLRRPGAAERMARSWRVLEPGLWFQVDEMSLPGLSEPVVVATLAEGGPSATEAVTTFARGDLAVLVVAGPGSPRYVKSALRRVAKPLADAFGEAGST